MATLITFEECLRNGIIREGDYVDPRNCFLINKTIVLKSKESGYHKNQLFNRNDDLNWFFVINDKGIPTLFGTPTQSKICLYGYKGFKHARDLFTKTISLYSNTDIKIKSRLCNEKDIKELRRTSEIVKLLNKDLTEIWLNNTFRDDSEYGIYTSKGIYINKFSLLESKCLGHYIEKSVRPVIELYDTEKILIDVESLRKEGVWKLFLAEKIKY